ncbi:MAG: hypothetical protein U1F41_03250 [Burkholderiales bacterium]
MFARIAPAVLCLALLSPGLAAQTKAASSCAWLSAEDAARVIGSGAKLERAADKGFCIFVRGPLTLQIAEPARLNNPGALEAAFAGAMKGSNGQLEPGIGSKAFVSANSRRIAFLKGDAFVVVDLMGEGAGPEQLPAFKEAAKKIASRF